MKLHGLEGSKIYISSEIKTIKPRKRIKQCMFLDETLIMSIMHSHFVLHVTTQWPIFLM